MADRRRCLGLLGGFGDGRLNGTMPNVVGPTLVAMATTFGLGAEIYRLPACLLSYVHVAFSYYSLLFCCTNVTVSAAVVTR